LGAFHKPKLFLAFDKRFKSFSRFFPFSGVQMNFTAGTAVLDLKDKVFLEDFYYESENDGAKFEDLHNLTLSIR
jgi:hypothetical protein